MRMISVMLAGLFIASVPVAYAATATTGVAQSYSTDTTVSQGMIVGIKPGDTTLVEPLTADTVSNMLGVTISASDAPLTLSDNSAGAQVYVATNGTYNVLVSDQNGIVHKGDYISISSLNGIGMKATDSEPIILGPAAADMTAASIVEKNVTIKSSSGTHVVNIALIPVNVGVGSNPSAGRGSGNLPGFLQIATQDIANKPVSAARVYLGIAVLILAAFISGSLLFSGVRNSIASIGRNPLAKPAIIRGLLQVILTGIIVFIIGLFAVYLLLRL